MDDYSEELMRSMRKSIRSLNGRLDYEAGKNGENLTMADLAAQGYTVKYVGDDHSKHYDIEARRGNEILHVENKAGLHSRLSKDEAETAKHDPYYRKKRTPRLMPRL